MLLVITILLLGYIIFVAVKLGLTERLPLAFSRISLDEIPDRAARMYKDKIIFTSNKPTTWKVAALERQYPDDRKWSALRIKETIDYLCSVMSGYIELNDRVAICKENHLDYHLFMQAIIRAGGIACPINNKFKATDFEPYLDHLGSRILITDSSTLSRILKEGGGIGGVKTIILAERKDQGIESSNIIQSYTFSNHVDLVYIEEALEKIKQPVPPVKRSADEVLYLVHSSGTTGFPKAVMLKNGAQSHAVKGWLSFVHVSRYFDKTFLAVPNNHQAVILSFNSSLLMGLHVHWYTGYDQYSFDADVVLRTLSKEKYTGFFAFPIVYTKIKEVPFGTMDLGRMRFWASTADAIHEVIQKHVVQTGNVFKSLGIPIDGAVYMDAQGSSEVGTPSVLRYVTRFTRKFDRRIGRRGSTPFGPKVRIRKMNGELANKGETGKLEVKGKTVLSGYWNNPELTKQSFTDGWFFTGDVASYANDGHIIQLDRLVDVIHTNKGEVYSLLIEEKIHKHPAVFDACVYGKYENENIQSPAIAVALRRGFKISESELLSQLNQLLEEREQLSDCIIMDWFEFPIGVTGKTLKRVFRERSKLKIKSQHTTSVF